MDGRHLKLKGNTEVPGMVHSLLIQFITSLKQVMVKVIQIFVFLCTMTIMTCVAFALVSHVRSCGFHWLRWWSGMVSLLWVPLVLSIYI